MIARMSIPGNLCVHCEAVIEQSLVCPGCGWRDPLTKSASKSSETSDPDLSTGASEN